MGGRAIPAPVLELPFALLYGRVEACGDGVQDARVLSDQATLAAAEQGQAGVQHQLDVLGVGEEVGRGGHVHDAPGRARGEMTS